MSDDAIKTAFHDVTASQGGTHVEDGGWMWLEGFGDAAKEHAAVRNDVAVLADTFESEPYKRQLAASVGRKAIAAAIRDATGEERDRHAA